MSSGSSALIVLSSVEGLMELILSRLYRRSNLFSAAFKLQVANKAIRRAVLSVDSFWVRIFQANYDVCLDESLCSAVTVRRFEEICALNPRPREACAIEFQRCFERVADYSFFEGVNAPLETVGLLERLCALHPALARASPVVWRGLFERLVARVVERNRLPEALALVRRFGALNEKAMKASTARLSVLILRFGRLMLNTLCAEFNHDINARCAEEGRTMLMEAVQKQVLDVIEELAEGAFAPKRLKRKRLVTAANPYGIDISVRCLGGKTVFDYVQEVQRADVRQKVLCLLVAISQR